MFEPKKRCTKCRELKYEGDFAWEGNRLCSWCRDCKRLSQSVEDRKVYNRRQQTERKHIRLVNSAKQRAAKKQLPFDLYEHYEEIERRIYEGACELTGVAFDLAASPATWNSPSIGRVKPELVYVYSDSRVICHSLNTAIGHWGEDQTAALMEAWLEMRKSK